MSKFCTNCGKELQKGAKFCNNCGSKIPESIEQEVMMSPAEAKEIATSLVYSAGALLPESKSSNLNPEDQESILITINFVEKLFESFPEINTENWIGQSEYTKIKNYLDNNKQNAPSPPPFEPSTPFNEKDSETSSYSDNVEVATAKPKTDGEEAIKSQIVGVHTSFGDIHYILYLTDRRIIGARKDRFDNAMQSGAAVGGILGAIVGAGVDVVRGPKETSQEKLEQLSPDQILAIDEQNWEIPYDNLIEVELKKPGFLRDGEIILVDPNRRFEWIFDVNKEEFEVVIKMFQEVVPGKLRIK